MRLILALAARYKPSSVKQSGASSASSGASSRQTSPATATQPSSSQTMVGLAHDAAAAIAAARQDAATRVQRPKRPKQLGQPERRWVHRVSILCSGARLCFTMNTRDWRSLCINERFMKRKALHDIGIAVYFVSKTRKSRKTHKFFCNWFKRLFRQIAKYENSLVYDIWD